MAQKKKTEFGWVAVFRHYGICSLLEDSILPGILSVLLFLLLEWGDANIREQLDFLLDIGFMVVPVMISLVLAAYAILLSYILSDSVSKVVEEEDGKEFIADLNSGFAAYLFISIIAIVLMIIVSCVLHFEIDCDYTNIVNSIVFISISFLLFYSVNILGGVVIDIFNIGQTRIVKK